MSISPQERPQIHQSASPSHLRSHQAVGLGPTSALSVTRTRWTRSSTPADTCVCATPAASNSRRCPTPAVPSAEGRSKTLSRPTGARKRTDGLLNNSKIPESREEMSKFRENELWYLYLVFSYNYCWLVHSCDLFKSRYCFARKVSFTLERRCDSELPLRNLFLPEERSVSPRILEDFEGEKLNQFQNSPSFSGAML